LHGLRSLDQEQLHQAAKKQSTSMVVTKGTLTKDICHLKSEKAFTKEVKFYQTGVRWGMFDL